MRGEVFFDTSILAYLFAINDSRTKIAEDLLEAGGTISVQVLNELVAVARRKNALAWDEIAEVIEQMCALCGEPRSLTFAIHVEGVRIAKRYRYQIYDSLILASAIEAGCSIVYSEDMQHGQRIGPLRIVNPFLNRRSS